MGLGTLGMHIDEFYGATPREFFAKADGWNVAKREAWEQVRWQTYVLVSMQLKKGKTIKPTDLIKFNWDSENKITKHTPEELQKHFDFMPDKIERNG